MADGGGETDLNIDIWKTKKLTEAQESTRGEGTSYAQVSRVSEMLGDEFGKASLDLSDDRFYSEGWNGLLESDGKFGFIIMNGHGALFGTLSGNTREVLHTFTVELPKRRGRNTERTALLDRLRMEKLHGSVRNAAELATQFTSIQQQVSLMCQYLQEMKVSILTQLPVFNAGLILAGSTDFRTELSQSDLLDPRLQAKVLIVVKVGDVPYGRDDGFNEAILLTTHILANAKLIEEKRLVGKYFVATGHDKYVFGVDDTLKALEMGAVETLIVCESLETNRYVLKNAVTGELVIKHLSKDQEIDQSNFREAETRAELEVQEKLSLPEWFANEDKRLGCTLEFVTNKSLDGRMFCRSFEGIGGILRYRLDMRTFDEESDGDND